MRGTKRVNLLAGSTVEVQDGRTSLPVMQDGNEPPDMLLALLNNVLPSIINSQQAKILATCLTSKGKATLVIFYGVVPTANNLLAVPTDAISVTSEEK